VEPLRPRLGLDSRSISAATRGRDNVAVITKAYTATPGAIIYASNTNRTLDDLYTLQAGNINSANLATSAVGTPNIENSAVTHDKTENTVLFWHENFG
jgi:hypothetical protein